MSSLLVVNALNARYQTVTSPLCKEFPTEGHNVPAPKTQRPLGVTLTTNQPDSPTKELRRKCRLHFKEECLEESKMLQLTNKKRKKIFDQINCDFNLVVVEEGLKKNAKERKANPPSTSTTAFFFFGDTLQKTEPSHNRRYGITGTATEKKKEKQVIPAGTAPAITTTAVAASSIDTPELSEEPDKKDAQGNGSSAAGVVSCGDKKEEWRSKTFVELSPSTTTCLPINLRAQDTERKLRESIAHLRRFQNTCKDLLRHRHTIKGKLDIFSKLCSAWESDYRELCDMLGSSNIPGDLASAVEEVAVMRRVHCPIFSLEERAATAAVVLRVQRRLRREMEAAAPFASQQWVGSPQWSEEEPCMKPMHRRDETYLIRARRCSAVMRYLWDPRCNPTLDQLQYEELCQLRKDGVCAGGVVKDMVRNIQLSSTISTKEDKTNKPSASVIQSSQRMSVWERVKKLEKSMQTVS